MIVIELLLLSQHSQHLKALVSSFRKMESGGGWQADVGH